LVASFEENRALFIKVDKTYQMDEAVAEVALDALDNLGFLN
jgi:hypothetical protein